MIGQDDVVGAATQQPTRGGHVHGDRLQPAGGGRVAWGSNEHSTVVPLGPLFNPSAIIGITNCSLAVCGNDGGCERR